MHCCFLFSGLDSDFPRLPLPPPLPAFLASGGLPSTLAGFVCEAPHACPFAFGLGVVGVVALICGSSLLGSSGVTSALLTFLGLGLTDEAVTPGKCPATVAYCINVTSTNEKSSTISVGLGFIIGMVLDLCWNTKFTFLLAAKCLVRILMKDLVKLRCGGQPSTNLNQSPSCTHPILQTRCHLNY